VGDGVDVGAEVGEDACVGARVLVGIVVAVCVGVAVSIGAKWVVGTPLGAGGLQAVVIPRTMKMVVKRSRFFLVVTVIQLPIFFYPAVQSSLTTRYQNQQ